MRLSSLQKHILKQCYFAKRSSRVLRKKAENFFVNPKTKIVTRSLERLIDRGLLIGYGERTKEKWFISEIKLTPLGRKVAKGLFGTQEMLPLS